jgi:hypothetical protein
VASAREAAMPPSLVLQTDPSRSRRRARLAVAALALWYSAVALAGPPYLGLQLDAVLPEFSSRGLELVYNSAIVPPSLRVIREPSPGTDLEVLAQLLEPHGLRASQVAGDVYAIVKAESSSTVATNQDAMTPRSVAPLQNVVVNASRYSLAAEIPDVHTFLTQTQVEAMPHLADDSLKAVHRLPGAASNGLSGLAHMRGGEENETLIVFDGLPMYEPFHLRLLQSPVSVLDQRVVDSLDVYAGGFTAEYGDRMSAIIDAQSVHPAADRYYELGLSLFHVNGLASQRFADGRGQWLASIRRSNLDVVADTLDSDLGEPPYMDGFARIDYEFSPATYGSLHMLLSSDKATVSNSAETEQVDAEYHNSYLWATLDHDWSASLHGKAVLSYTDVSSERAGDVSEEGQRNGYVDDNRDYEAIGLKLDGSYATDRWVHRFGAEVRWLNARYDYEGHVRFEPGYPFPGSPAQEIDQSLAPEPSGAHYAAYLSSRFRITDALTAELGLRWDTQTYGEDADNPVAPRANIVWNLDDATRLRASWGRYEQFQGIEELQVEDGIDEFQRAQYADHAIIGIERDLSAGFSVRAEAYRKDYGRPRVRFESLFDPLSLAPELRWDRVRIAPSAAVAEGAELLLTRKGSDPWSGWISYAWSRVEDTTAGDTTVRSWNQANAVSGGVTWSDSGWLVTLAGTYHSGWPVTPLRLVDSESGPVPIVGPRNRRRYADFSSVDFRVSRDFPLARGTLNAFVEVTNAFDRRNPCCTDFSYETEEDGSVVLESEVRHWLPLVPSIGVLWKF